MRSRKMRVDTDATQGSDHARGCFLCLADTLYEDDELSPEREHLKREESRQLHRAIKALPAEQQEVLHLRFGCGLRCTEIAPVLDKSEGAVRTLLYRAVQTLRDLYASAGKGNRTKQGKSEKR